MAPRLSGQTFIFGVVFFMSKSLLGIEGQKKLEKFAILTRKPRSHARILIYRTWPIRRNLKTPAVRFYVDEKHFGFFFKTMLPQLSCDFTDQVSSNANPKYPVIVAFLNFSGVVLV